MVKNPLAGQETEETQIHSMGWEDALEEGMATHSSILARKIPWTEERGGLQPMGLQRVRHDWATNTFTFNWINKIRYSIQCIYLYNGILNGVECSVVLDSL